MVTQIQLGSFFSANGRTVLGGLGGSGLDTESLIKSLTDAKRLPATRLEDKIKVNDGRLSALSEFNQLLSKMKDAANFLRNPPGVGNDADNVFRYATAEVTSNTSVSGETYVTVAASPGVTLQNYTINEVTSVALARKQRTGDINIATADAAAVSSSPAAGQFKAGTFTLNGVGITLSDGDSLNTVAAKFNAVKNDTGIAVNIIKVDSGKYQLSFVATESGTNADFDLNNVDVPGTLVDPGAVFSTAVTITNVQDAQDAVFELNGVTITRQSNNITDVVSGLTFTLWQATPEDTELDVSVRADETIVKNGITNFVNAYNDLKLFAAQQTEIDDTTGTYKDTAVLANNSTFRNTISSVNSQLASLVSGITGGDPSRLADLGITFSDLPESTDNPKVPNILTIDDGKLTAAIASNFDGVRRVFEFDFVSDSPNLRTVSRTNALGVTQFTIYANAYDTQVSRTLSVTDADTAIVADSPSGDQLKSGVLTINGQTITLVAGDTLNNVVSKFNAVEADSGMHAELVTVAAGQYKLSFTSTPTDTGNNNFNLKSSGVDSGGVFSGITFSTTGVYQATYNLGSGPVTVNLTAGSLSGGATGVSLRGPAGGPLEGLSMVYASFAAAEIDVDVTQGLSDRVYNTTDAAIRAGGALAVDKTSIEDNTKKLNEEIARIDAQVERYRNQLLDKFGALEQALSKVNTLLQSIDAQNQARNNG